jgi:superfamily II DNA/RNA helicase
MTTFTALGVPSGIVDALTRRGIDRPFPIQSATIADALAGRDVCGRAPTGSGKTLAFGIPVAALAAAAAPRRPTALILVPTRELAAQVCDALRPLAQARGRRVAAFYGGMPIGRDRDRLQRGVDIAVACPGRLADLVQRRDVDLRDVATVVVDEADRMADMGFLPEVRRLLDATRDDRQTLLFSATLDGDVDVLIRHYQRDPVRHELAPAEDADAAVTHHFWRTAAHDRIAVTRDIVNTVHPAIVFTRTKHGADRLARQLDKAGVPAAAIHGDRNQRQRERALADFSAGRVRALVATDVAARGIHVDQVGAVVHFDPAGTDKDYVHRSGRTGRAGAEGVVVTLVVPDRRDDVHRLQRALALPQGAGAVALHTLGGAPAVTTAARGAPSGAPADTAPQERAARPGGTARPNRRPKAGGRADRTGRGQRHAGRGGTPPAGTSKAGTPKAGTPRAGTPRAGTSRHAAKGRQRPAR